MNIHASRSAAQPRYLVLADLLRADITSGVVMPGDRMPSESELATLHGYSRGTVVRAIESLVAEGLVTRRQGSGSFVAHRSLHRRAGQLTSFSDSARADGHSTAQRLLSFAPANEADARGLGVDLPAMTLSRLRLVDGAACALHRSLLPYPVCRQMGLLDDAAPLSASDFSLYALFEACGLHVQEARERVSARLASEREAGLLNIDRPAAVITVMRTSHGIDGQLLEAVEAVYQADVYTYDMHLLRGPKNGGNPSDRSGLRLASSTNTFDNSLQRKDVPK